MFRTKDSVSPAPEGGLALPGRSREVGRSRAADDGRDDCFADDGREVDFWTKENQKMWLSGRTLRN